MRTRAWEAEFVEFVRDHRAGLVRTAAMWCHGDVHRGEDLVQVALSRVYVAWPRIATGAALAYTRRALFHALLDERRRPSSRREDSAAQVPDHADPSTAEPRVDHDLDADVLAALARLPTRMRAAVVLRHLDALSVAETADVLGCSHGTVKSQTARGLAQLRTAFAHPGEVPERPPPVPSRSRIRRPLRPTPREALR